MDSCRRWAPAQSGSVRAASVRRPARNVIVDGFRNMRDPGGLPLRGPARRNVRGFLDASGCCLHDGEGKALPEPSQSAEQRHVVVPPVAIALKAALYEAFREAGMSQRRLAHDLGVAESEVRRMLNATAHHASTRRRRASATRRYTSTRFGAWPWRAWARSTPATAGVSQFDPIGSPVAGAGKAAAIHQRLDRQRLDGEARVPIGREGSGAVPGACPDVSSRPLGVAGATRGEGGREGGLITLWTYDANEANNHQHRRHIATCGCSNRRNAVRSRHRSGSR